MSRSAFARLSFVAMVTILLLSACSGGSSAGNSAAPPVPPPSIDRFTASPSSIGPGQSATLAWSVSGANALSLAPAPGTVTGSSLAVDPSVTTTYTLTASNTAGSVQAAVTVTVAAPPVPVLHLAIATHSEDRHHPQTPDYQVDKSAYTASRSGLLAFAEAMAARDLKWNWQSDYNFLEACRKWEIQTPDAALLAATGGKNIVRYLRENLGVECDPHSHENDGYNYADVAYLMIACGVEPAPVVGGHIYDPSDPGFQNWPRFNAGISGSTYPSAFWKPQLLMGAGTGQHRNDPTASGLWRPLSSAAFFATGGTGVAAFGGWDNQPESLSGMVQSVSSGQLDPGRMWTFTLVLGQQDFPTGGYLQGQVLPLLDQIVAMRTAGQVKVVQFTEALALWKDSFGGVESVYRPAAAGGTSAYFTFTLNTQDFSYPDESAALVTRVLDLHEALGVPLDVSFTTSHAELFAAQYADLWSRLKTSGLVALSTHTRAPKPYASDFDWTGMGSKSLAAQQAVVQAYETHGLDPASGQPTPADGGFVKVKALAGYSPYSIGSMPDGAVAEAVCGVLSGYGARFAVAHGRAVNLGERARGLTLKPEHVDLKLFESVGQDPGSVLESALQQAQALGGAQPPYFVGVKMHDNDFFAEDSAWITVYTRNGKPVLAPPWDMSRKSVPLSAAERNAVWTHYEGAVRHAASIRDRVGLVNLRDVAAMIP